MSDLLEKLAYSIERGKEQLDSNYPPDLRGEPGAFELCRQALEDGIAPDVILKNALTIGMRNIGDKFGQGKAFIPELLMSAKAMNAAMKHLKPYFEAGDVSHKGTLVLGTVAGDLHDIGKNIVRMVLEGDGWKVIDLGVDVTADKFLAAIEENGKCIVAMSALLTTSMANMQKTLKAVRANHNTTPVYIGGAPVTAEFADKIHADGYFPDPYKFAKHLSMNLS